MSGCEILLFSWCLSQTLPGCKTHHWVFTSSSQNSYLYRLKTLISFYIKWSPEAVSCVLFSKCLVLVLALVLFLLVCRCQKMCCAETFWIFVSSPPSVCSCGSALRVTWLWLTFVTHLSLFKYICPRLFWLFMSSNKCLPVKESLSLAEDPSLQRWSQTGFSQVIHLTFWWFIRSLTLSDLDLAGQEEVYQ